MARVLRGDIFWADLEPVQGSEQGGRRPVLILSHELFNRRSDTVIAMAITSRLQRAGYPLTLRLPDELAKPSWIKISQVRTLSTRRLGRRASRITETQMTQVIEGLLELIS